MEPPTRARMVAEQLVPRGITDARVLAAMEAVPRERFVAPAYARYAYIDAPLPIAEGQTISQPYVVAWMIQALECRPGDRVLEVGTGSGYAAAVLAQIVRQVYTIERHERLARDAAALLEELGVRNVEVRHGDGTLGWPEAAPFDAIVVAAGGPEVPAALTAQLADGGRLVIPVGPSTRGQRLVRVTRVGGRHFVSEDLGAVQFVPLIGEQGWRRTHARDHEVSRVRAALTAYR